MGATNFSTIEKKYKQDGLNYVLAKYRERQIYERINDEITKLKQQANKKQKLELQFIQHEKSNFQKKFSEALQQAKTKNPQSIEQAEAKAKQKVEQFSGFNDELKEIQKIQKDVKDKFEKQRMRMQDKVREEVRKYQNNSSQLTKIPEYDDLPDNYKKSIEKECSAKYPSKAVAVNITELENKLTWTNFKQNFENILDRQKFKTDLQNSSKRVNDNVIPGGAAICC